MIKKSSTMTEEKKAILSMNFDDKIENIKKELKKHGILIEKPFFKKPALFSISLLIYAIYKKKPKAIIIRYLNDHKLLTKSILLFLSRLSTIFICYLFRIDVFWILHNVDKETTEFFPKLTKFTRKLLGNSAKVILVTDPLLVKTAQEKYPNWKERIDYITFGEREPKKEKSTDIRLLDIFEKISNIKKNNDLTLFCPTSPGDKYIHLHFTSKLIENAKINNLNYRVVIVGGIKEYLDINPELERSLSDENIYLLSENITYNIEDIEPYIDAYWRAMSDQSISYTLYEAASRKIPILTLNTGFLTEAITKYNLGSSLELDFSNFKQSHDKIKSWDKINAKLFLKSHSWQLAAHRLARNLES